MSVDVFCPRCKTYLVENGIARDEEELKALYLNRRKAPAHQAGRGH